MKIIYAIIAQLCCIFYWQMFHISGKLVKFYQFKDNYLYILLSKISDNG